MRRHGEDIDSVRVWLAASSVALGERRHHPIHCTCSAGKAPARVDQSRCDDWYVLRSPLLSRKELLPLLPTPVVTTDPGTHDEAKIQEDLDSHLLQTEWNNYRTLLLRRHQERRASASLHDDELQKRKEALQNQSKIVHAKLDERMDSVKSQVVDLEVELGHDVEKLRRKFEGDAPRVSCHVSLVSLGLAIVVSSVVRSFAFS